MLFKVVDSSLSIRLRWCLLGIRLSEIWSSFMFDGLNIYFWSNFDVKVFVFWFSIMWLNWRLDLELLLLLVISLSFWNIFCYWCVMNCLSELICMFGFIVNVCWIFLFVFVLVGLSFVVLVFDIVSRLLSILRVCIVVFVFKGLEMDCVIDCIVFVIGKFVLCELL